MGDRRPTSRFYSRRSDDSSDSSNGSTGSSLSSSAASASVWSTPRARTTTSASDHNTTNATIQLDVPRRSGTSFRVSLQPHSHTKRRSGGKRSTIQEDQQFLFQERFDDCMTFNLTKVTRWISSNSAKRVAVALVLSCLLGTIINLIPSPGQHPGYDSYIHISTEDRVAQHEYLGEDEKSSRFFSNSYDNLSNKSEQKQINKGEPASYEGEHQRNKAVMASYGSAAGVGGSTMPNASREKAASVTRVENSTSYAAPVQQDYKTNRTVVAYVLPVFMCYTSSVNVQSIELHGTNEPANDQEFRDSALMLQASVHQNSIRNARSGSVYDYQMVALVHSDAQQCKNGANRTEILQNLGYRVEIVQEPIHQVNINDEYLKEHAPMNNGGGMKEMIRLYAFKLEDYPIVVLVEPTTWILHPLDAIYDVLMNGPRGHPWVESHPDHVVRSTWYPNGTITNTPELPKQVDLLFTRDFSMLTQDHWLASISMSFLPLRPSNDTFNQLTNIYQSTPYDSKYGWDHKGYVDFAGSMTTKGLLMYFYSELYPERKLELHRCIYNNLADVPYIAEKQGARDQCRDVKEQKKDQNGAVQSCTDCRAKPWGDIAVSNFENCQPPWTCPYVKEVQDLPLVQPTLAMCRRMHHSWFALRKVVEDTFLLPKERANSTGTFYPEIFMGYCMAGEKSGGYVPVADVQLPFGLKTNRAVSA